MCQTIYRLSNGHLHGKLRRRYVVAHRVPKYIIQCSGTIFVCLPMTIASLDSNFTLSIPSGITICSSGQITDFYELPAPFPEGFSYIQLLHNKTFHS